jgi:carbon monoxide dehydrogenase subunit G
MPTIETSIVIGRPAGEVFAFLADPRNTPRWTPSVKTVTVDGPMRVGARGRDVLNSLGRRLEENWLITKHEPGRRYAFQYEGPLSGVVVYTLEPVAEGTRVTCRADLRGRGFFKLLTPLMAMEGKKEDEANFRRLKQLVEAAGPAEQAPAVDGHANNGAAIA